MKIFKNISAFEQEPFLAYCCNQNLGDLIRGKEIFEGKLERIHNNKKQLDCNPYLNRRDIMCSQQVLETNTEQVTELAKRF